MKNLTVALGDRSYPIVIARTFAEVEQTLCQSIRGLQVMIVTDEVTAPLYLTKIKSMLAAFEVKEVILPAGEHYKTLETVEDIISALLEANFDRTSTIIGLGGGVVGDTAGFVASCYQRGVDFIQVPTTLLAQVDSSVGGKTGVNHTLGKNMIGAFKQPNCVAIVSDTLQTLSARQFSSGLAEVIKYGVILDAVFFTTLEKRMEKIMQKETEALHFIIEKSCRLKAQIVSQDEAETKDLRALLNFGHTFGHAIEKCQNYKGLSHGEAVAVGMVMAEELSFIEGWEDETGVKRVKALIKRAGLPTLMPNAIFSIDLFEAMQVDKKALNHQLRLILTKPLGTGIITTAYQRSNLDAIIKHYCN